MISTGARWIVSYDPKTGKERWRLRHGQGFSNGSCPVVSHGRVIFSTGCMKANLLAVDVNGAGEIPVTNVVWRITEHVPVMSSPTVGGEEIYWVSDDGLASCADARTGETYWQKRVGGRTFASPLFAEGRVYFFAQDGKATVIRAGRQFEKLAENQLEGPVVATPAIVDGAIYLRTDTHLTGSRTASLRIAANPYQSCDRRGVRVRSPLQCARMTASRVLTSRPLWVLTSCLTALTLAHCGAANFYVSLTGNDADPGTKAKPFGTLGARARGGSQAQDQRAAEGTGHRLCSGRAIPDQGHLAN